MNKFLAGFIGTYALVFFGTGAIIVNQEVNGVITNVGIAIIFGLIVMAMIYTLGNVSGAHINPAVSIPFAISKRLPCRTRLWRFYESCPFDSAGNCIGPFETVVDIYICAGYRRCNVCSGIKHCSRFKIRLMII